MKIGKRKEVGPLWMWGLEDDKIAYCPALEGCLEKSVTRTAIHISTTVSVEQQIGENPTSGTWDLQRKLHRLTDAIAPELFPNYNDWVSRTYRIFGGHDYPNYYLRKGFEIALRWEPVMPTHSFKLAMVAESHDSLEKSTDWSLVNWISGRKVRENPPITPGQYAESSVSNTILIRGQIPSVGITHSW